MILILKKINCFGTIVAEVFQLKVFEWKCTAKLHICYEHSDY
jgi:hypothetical protein